MSLDLRGIHHVAICVDDLDAAVDFYVGVVGLELAERPDSLPNPGAWLDLGEQQVHLLSGTDRAPSTFQHFSIHVSSMDEAAAHFAHHGIEIEQLQVIEGYGLQGFVRDPSGNLVELYDRRWPLPSEEHR